MILPDKLISRIKAVLNGGTGYFEIQSLANDYSELVMKTRDRVDQCVALIRAGNDYAALQVAESPPPLLDTAAKLAFAESPEWLAFCRENNVPWPPPLDPHAIELVNNLYGRSIGETHPLYRDYRQAIRERDDLRAIAVLGSIIRINPADQNARGEFLRLAAKVAETFPPRLVALLDAGDNTAAFNLAATLENLHLPALAGAPALKRVRQLREQEEQAAAAAEALDALREAAALRDAADWEGAIPLIGRCRSYEAHYKRELPEDARANLTALEAWASGEHEKHARARARETSIRDAERELRDALAQAAAPGAGKAQFLAAARRLDLAAAVVAALAKSAEPPAPDARLVEAATRRRAEMASVFRRRKASYIAAAAFAACAAAAGGALYFAHTEDTGNRAAAMTHMASLPAANRLLDAENFEKSLKPDWDTDAAFADEHRKLRAWIAEWRKRADATLRAADAMAALGETAFSPATLRSQLAALDTVKKQAAALPEDMRDDAARRLAAATKSLNAIRVKFAADALPIINSGVEEIETAFAAVLANPTAAGRIKLSAPLLPRVAKLDEIVPPLQYLLPAELVRRWVAIRATFINSRAEWTRDARANTALAGARTVDEHYRALREVAAVTGGGAATAAAATAGSAGVGSAGSGVASSGSASTASTSSTASTAAAPAAAVSTASAAAPTPPAPFATLFAAEPAMRDPAPAVLAPAVHKLWRVAAATSGAMLPFLPATTLPGEAADASRLVQNKAHENIYRHILSLHPAGPKPLMYHIYSHKPKRVERLPVGDGFDLRQTIDVFRADGSIESKTYSFLQLGHVGARGTRLDKEILTPESAFLRQFSRFYDAAAGRVVEPLPVLLDRVRGQPGVSPLLKAWLIQELFKIGASRPEDWGLSFSPSALAARGKLSAATQGALTAGSWLEVARWSDRLPAVQAFFAGQQNSWQAEGAAWLRVFQRLSRPGFVKIGYVTSEKTVVLTAGRAPVGYLVGVSPTGAVVRVETGRLLQPGSGAVRALREPAVFAKHSPVLMLDIQPAQAATLAAFPAGTQQPPEGWEAFVFQPLPTAPAATAAAVPTATATPPTSATTPTSAATVPTTPSAATTPTAPPTSPSATAPKPTTPAPAPAAASAPATPPTPAPAAATPATPPDEPPLSSAPFPEEPVELDPPQPDPTDSSPEEPAAPDPAPSPLDDI